MSEAFRTHDIATVLATAGRALAGATTESGALHLVARLSDDARRNLLLRCVWQLPAGPRPVIVKVTRDPAYDAAATNAFAELGLVKEWAALSLVARRAAGSRLGPLLHAGDAGLGLLVLDDLGAAAGSLVGPLLGASPETAERALVAYASALGRLHRETAGCADEHARALVEAFPASAPPRRENSPGLLRWAQRTAEVLGGRVVPDEIAEVAHRLDAPGAWLALVHGDPCPDNVLFVGGEARLID